MFTLIAQNTQVVDIASQVGKITPIQSVGRVIEIGVGTILTIGGLALFVYLVMGGFNWIMAGGDKGKVEQAREMITQSIIGFVILASVFALYRVILSILGVQSINVGQSTSGAPSGSNISCGTWCAGTPECEKTGGKTVANLCPDVGYSFCSTGTKPCGYPR